MTGNMRSESYIGGVLYQESAEVAAQYKQAYTLAKMLLTQRIAENGGTGKNLAIVTDIDATLIDDSTYFAGVLLDAEGRKKLGQAPWNHQDWLGYYTASVSETAKAVPGAVEFIQFAREQGVQIFFITNRPYYEFDLTVQQLYRAGFIDDAVLQAYADLGDAEKRLQEYHTAEETEALQAFRERINTETAYEIGKGYFSLKNDYTIQVQGTDFSNDKAERRANVEKQLGENGKVVLYLGDSINDMVSPNEYLYTGYSQEESEQFDSTKGNSSRTESVMNDVWKEKWGTEFIVMPNAAYGDWQKATWYNRNVSVEEEMEAIRKQLNEHSYRNAEIWYDGTSPVGDDIQ